MCVNMVLSMVSGWQSKEDLTEGYWCVPVPTRDQISISASYLKSGELTCDHYSRASSSVVHGYSVLDMLKFHKFTIGHAWWVSFRNHNIVHYNIILIYYTWCTDYIYLRTTDYGNPDEEAAFKYIYK